MYRAQESSSITPRRNIINPSVRLFRSIPVTASHGRKGGRPMKSGEAREGESSVAGSQYFAVLRSLISASVCQCIPLLLDRLPCWLQRFHEQHSFLTALADKLRVYMPRRAAWSQQIRRIGRISRAQYLLFGRARLSRADDPLQLRTQP